METGKRPLSLDKKSSLKKTKQNTMHLLAYCHSHNHGFRKITNELNLPTNIQFDANDLYGTHKNDITFDLSNNYYQENFLNNIYKKKYDYIYLENCPSYVYIDDEQYNFNKVLFENLLKILKNKGVVITRLSDEAIETLTGEHLNFIDDDIKDELRKSIKFRTLSSSEFNEKMNEIELNITNQTKRLLNHIRYIMQNFFIESKLHFHLLDEENSKQYINDNENKYEYFVIKKNEQIGGKKNKIYTGPKGGKYIIHNQKKKYI